MRKMEQDTYKMFAEFNTLAQRAGLPDFYGGPH